MSLLNRCKLDNKLQLTRDDIVDFSHYLPGLQQELTSVLLPLLLILGAAVVLTHGLKGGG